VRNSLAIKDTINFVFESLDDYTFPLSKSSYGYDREGFIWKDSELIEKQEKGLICTANPRQDVFFENILLGYIQECLDGTWLGHSPYNAFNLGDVAIFGFVNKFYAVRYLHQITKILYPDEIGDFLYVPWEDKQLRGYASIGENIASLSFKLSLSDS
jgi:hypothetical protein